MSIPTGAAPCSKAHHRERCEGGRVASASGHDAQDIIKRWRASRKFSQILETLSFSMTSPCSFPPNGTEWVQRMKAFRANSTKSHNSMRWPINKHPTPMQFSVCGRAFVAHSAGTTSVNRPSLRSGGEELPVEQRCAHRKSAPPPA